MRGDRRTWPYRIGRSVRRLQLGTGRQLKRRVGDLALFVYVKRLCSNCRCDASVLAESWKIMHSCAYMRRAQRTLFGMRARLRRAGRHPSIPDLGCSGVRGDGLG